MPGFERHLGVPEVVERASRDIYKLHVRVGDEVFDAFVGLAAVALGHRLVALGDDITSRHELEEVLPVFELGAVHPPARASDARDADPDWVWVHLLPPYKSVSRASGQSGQ